MERSLTLAIATCSCRRVTKSCKDTRDRRPQRDRETWLLVIAYGFSAAAEIGMKEHDRLALPLKMFERMPDRRRISSKLPELVELAMAKRWCRPG